MPFGDYSRLCKQGVDAGTFKKEEGQKMFEAADNQDVRLDLLKSFLEKQGALYNIAPTTQNKKEKGGGNPLVHLVNE